MINQKIRYAFIKDYIFRNKKQLICEVGSGSKGLGQYFKSIRFTGVDIDFADYTKKSRRTAVNMKAVKADARKLPFKDDSFDLVFSFDMIEHIRPAERPTVIKELIRISRDLVIVGFPCGVNAHKMDLMHLNYFKKINQIVPGWLEEHLAIPYPREYEVDKILKKKQKKYSIYKQESMILHILVHLFESVSFGRSEFDYLIPFPLLKGLSLRGNKFYRKIYVIKKN